MENGVAFRLHPKEGIVHSSRDKRGWTPPSTGWAKLNTDIGFCIDIGKASTGVVVRYMNDKVILSVWRSLNHIVSTEETKAVACLEGLRLTQEWIWFLTCVETYCKQFAQAREKGEPTRSRWAGLIEELKEVSQLPGVQVYSCS
jgi:hypothetical protein